MFDMDSWFQCAYFLLKEFDWVAGLLAAYGIAVPK